MPSLEYDIGEQARAGSRFITDVKEELQRAWSLEKSQRRLTYQSVAEKLGINNRSVVNRMVMGLENMTIRSVAELLWAIGWEPHFEARKIHHADGVNEGFGEPAALTRAATVKSSSIGTLKGFGQAGTL